MTLLLLLHFFVSLVVPAIASQTHPLPNIMASEGTTPTSAAYNHPNELYSETTELHILAIHQVEEYRAVEAMCYFALWNVPEDALAELLRFPKHQFLTWPGMDNGDAGPSVSFLFEHPFLPLMYEARLVSGPVAAMFDSDGEEVEQGFSNWVEIADFGLFLSKKPNVKSFTLVTAFILPDGGQDVD